MKISKTIIYLTIAIMAMTGCNDQTETQSQNTETSTQDNKPKDTIKSQEPTIEKPAVEKETYSFQKTLQFKVYRSM
jgi:PBP1b-binding outer membrane lipoprotein LpoB